MEQIRENIKQIKAEIEEACRRVKREAKEVKLLAVSKTVPVAVLAEAYQGGQVLFGESRAQELKCKVPLLPEEISWHFIGTLQRNKVKDVVGRVALIHSVDSLALAREINKRAGKKGLLVDLLLQVNVAGEETKRGFTPLEVVASAREIGQLPAVRLKGLMTLAPYVENAEKVRPFFRELKALAQTLEQLQLPGVQMQELSMGMSHDFTVAVEEGATIVRLGSRIFGKRNELGR